MSAAGKSSSRERTRARARDPPTAHTQAHEHKHTLGRSLTAAKGFTSHWLRLISASIAGAVGTSIAQWSHDMASNLLDIGDLAAIDAGAA